MKLAFKKSRCWPLIAVAALLVALMAQPALAVGVSTNWQGPNPNTLWSNPNNWTAGVPGFDDLAFLTSTTSKTATLNVNTPTLAVVYANASSGTFTINQSYYPLGSLNTTAETIGDSGVAVYNQNAGNHTVGGVTGFLAPDTIAQTLVLGFSAGGSGTYNNNGGNLTTGALVVGLGGTGVFKGTNVTVGNATPDTGQPFSLILGGFYNSGAPITTGNGTFTMTSGNLNVAGGAVVGQAGTGNFSMTSGTTNIGGPLAIGNLAGSTGTFSMTSGTLKVGGFEYIGASGSGTFKMTSGTNTVGGEFNVGRNGGSSGSYEMTSGTLKVGGNALIGYFGPGTFSMTSGSVSIGGDLSIADQAGVPGSFSMTSGSLKVTGDEIVGNNGNATFSMTSGSNSAKTITMAAQPGSTATYSMTSGSVSATDPAKPANAIWVKGPYDGNIPSATGANFLINGGGTINGNVTNDGLIKTSNATVTWNGVVTNNSAYVSDPGSTQTFIQDLVINQTGYLVATAPLKANKKANDKFVLKEDFVMADDNTQVANWDTHLALLNFNKGTDKIHDLSVAGVNNGAPGKTGGVSNVVLSNYAWGSLDIANQTLNLLDANTAVNPGALYVNYLLTGVDITGTVATNINNTSSHNLFIYYNPDVNGYLLDATYTWNSGGGELRPYHTPIPPSVLLMGSGLLGLGLLGWRRRRLNG